VRDDLSTKRLAGQLLRGVKAVHEENNPGRPLCPGVPVRPHVAAERIGISPVGHRYAATLAYLEEQGALELNWRTGNAAAVGEPRYVLGERGLKLLEEV
jgi:hypothetical protein